MQYERITSTTPGLESVPHDTVQSRRLANLSEVLDSGVLTPEELAGVWAQAQGYQNEGDTFMVALERAAEDAVAGRIVPVHLSSPIRPRHNPEPLRFEVGDRVIGTFPNDGELHGVVQSPASANVKEAWVHFEGRTGPVPVRVAQLRPVS
jgi:hypothetical protein